MTERIHYDKSYRELIMQSNDPAVLVDLWHYAIGNKQIAREYIVILMHRLRSVLH